MRPWYTECLVLVWCISGVHLYNLQRVESEKDQQLSLEIDFYTNYEHRKFHQAVERSHDSHEDDPRYLHSDQSTSETDDDDATPLDSWSVIWYVASFGGLIAFFLIVSCSEWCCRRAVRNSNCNAPTNPPAGAHVPDTPPPSYDQFAPPSYESIRLGRSSPTEKSEYDIFVVPVHALGTIMATQEDAPPSYLSASGDATFTPACPPISRNYSMT